MKITGTAFRWMADGEGEWFMIRSPKARQALEGLREGKTYDVEIKEHRERRSLSANAMMWLYCEKIAQAVGSTKEEVYRYNIKQVGKYTPLPIKADAVEEFGRIWSEHGTGWFTEIVDDSKLDGYKLVFAYHGSSCYDTKQMSRLLTNVLQDAASVGVPTASPEEVKEALERWGE